MATYVASVHAMWATRPRLSTLLQSPQRAPGAGLVSAGQFSSRAGTSFLYGKTLAPEGHLENGPQTWAM